MPNMTNAEYQAFLARGGFKSEHELNKARAEHELHSEIIAECRRRGWIAIHSRMDKRTTTVLGVPDFVILADYGRTFYIECKTKSKISIDQLSMQAMARKLGHEIHVVTSIYEFCELVAVRPQ